MDALNIKSANLIGWSLGGGVCMNLAIEHPTYVKRLILMASIHAGGFVKYVTNK